MVRVPTYASYMNLLNTTMNTKSMVDHYSYQSATGIKYANYAGYGMKASNIVNMEASKAVAQNFINNNTVLNTTITTMSTVMENIESSVSSFKSQLNNSLSVLSNLQDGKPVSVEVAASVAELQTVAFSAMSLLSDGLNNSLAGKYIFGAGSTSAPTQFNFETLEAFQNYYDGININYPSTRNAVLDSRRVEGQQAGDLTITQGAQDNEFVLSAPGGFSSLAVTGGSETTGDLSLSATDNTLKADIYGAFSTVGAGDTLLIKAGTETTRYIVSSVSKDGKTITFSDETPVTADADYTGGLSGGSPVTISTSYAVGSVINLDGTGNASVASVMQVKDINDDGSLVVTADPERFSSLPVTVPASAKWTLSAESYYVGGSASETFRISDSQSITLDISANDSVFDKLFRAFGTMAQGHLIKTDTDGNITNAAEVKELVNEAMSFLQSAVNNNGKATDGKNETMSLVIAKISANYVTLDNVNNTLNAVIGNLDDSIYDIKNVDQTEAAAKLLMAQNSLEASYQVLGNVLNLSLLDFLK